MEVVNLPSDDSSSGTISKHLPQGRDLPPLLMDSHPSANCYPSFRPHQARHSLKNSSLKETDSVDHMSGILFGALSNDTSCQLLVGKSPENHRSKSRSQRIKRHRSSIIHRSNSRSEVTSHTGESMQQTHKVSKMGLHGKSLYMDGPDYLVNPEPAPFMPQNFLRDHGLLPFPRSSTILKRFPYIKRHQDMFGGNENNSAVAGQRGVILHTDRYAKFELPKGFESISLNQKDRLLAEMEYIEYLRGIRRRRELVPHRAELDLFMGGRKIEFEERFDLNREIQKLKTMAMPVKARDLYHGRGIQLPENHTSLKPRPIPGFHLNDFDADDDVRSSAPSSLQGPPQPFLQDLDMAALHRKISLSLGDMPQVRTAPRSKHYKLPSIGNRMGPGFHHDSGSLPQPQSTMAQSAHSAAAWVHEQNKFLFQQQESAGTSQDKEHMPAAPPPTAGKTTAAGKKSGQAKSVSLNPLKRGAELSVPEEQMSSLRQTFQRLDTDMDGHLQYDQLRSQLPIEFSREQEYFVRQVYELTSSNTFFGVDEFLMMSKLTEKVASLTGEAAEAFGSLDFDTLGEFIIKYGDHFQTHDSSQRGHITVEALREVLSLSTGRTMDDGSPDWKKVMDSISLDYGKQVNKIDYLAHIPLFITMEGGRKQ